ncbi:hypothetical protein [Cupriavidus taiwanensis]|uniref:hypothetical protein n=1 Tax=Cupriavidus taiwanensis TaxID=164546 RepID=UPI000E107ABD|nr:hypothetical protein [Cupriavidus taiwanensis]SPA29612.1 putative membrane lipoprotein, cell wall extensin motif [Cupriavidus taiwanensis]SPA48740.1 putative membrane lipoprotein, cell wall extensin motif [Cupriavidus taiwanensis]
MKPRLLLSLVVLPVLLGAFGATAHADDDWDDDDRYYGRHHGRYHKGDDYKEEFWVGNCKIKRKWKDNGEYKEERKCKDRPVVYQPPPPPPVYYQPEPALVISPHVVIRP